MSELGDVTQVIRMMFDGLTIAFKVGQAGMKLMKKGMELIALLVHREKLMGETSLKNMLKSGSELQVFQFDARDFKQFQKLAKQYGVLYSEIPYDDRDPSTKEVFFPAEAASRVNMIIQRLQKCRIQTFENFIGDIPEAELDDMLAKLRAENEKLLEQKGMTQEELSQEMIGEAKAEQEEQAKQEAKEKGKSGDESTEKEASKSEGKSTEKAEDTSEVKTTETVLREASVENIREIRDRMILASKVQNEDLKRFYFSEEMIASEAPAYLVVRIPGMDGRSIWLNKEDVLEDRERGGYISFLDKGRSYSVVDEENQVVESMNGKELYEEHYEPSKQEAARQREAAGRRGSERQKNRDRQGEKSKKDAAIKIRNGHLYVKTGEFFDRLDKAGAKKVAEDNARREAYSGKSR